MEKFTTIDELQEAIKFLKETKDPYYTNMFAWDCMETKGYPEILDKANKVYKQLNENSASKGTLLEKRMLHD